MFVKVWRSRDKIEINEGTNPNFPTGERYIYFDVDLISSLVTQLEAAREFRTNEDDYKTFEV